MVRIGLLGCGNVGRIIATHQEGFEVVAVFDQMPDHAGALAQLTGAVSYSDFESFLAADFSVCVEAASIAAVRAYAIRIAEQGREMVILSVGALADTAFRTHLVEVAREKGGRIHIPSGAIMGLDNLKIGQISSIESILLRTTKSPGSLGMTVTTRTLAFSGRASECVRLFPKNTNVSVAIALASNHEVEVELWADPEVDQNIHEILVKGEFGEAYTKITNFPSPDNPATSYLAALSVLSLLKNIHNPLVIGT